MSLFPFPHLSEKGIFVVRLPKPFPLLSAVLTQLAPGTCLGREFTGCSFFFSFLSRLSKYVLVLVKKVCLSFSVRCYRKTQTNFLTTYLVFWAWTAVILPLLPHFSLIFFTYYSQWDVRNQNSPSCRALCSNCFLDGSSHVSLKPQPALHDPA